MKVQSCSAIAPAVPVYTYSDLKDVLKTKEGIYNKQGLSPGIFFLVLGKTEKTRVVLRLGTGDLLVTEAAGRANDRFTETDKVLCMEVK